MLAFEPLRVRLEVGETGVRVDSLSLELDCIHKRAVRLVSDVLSPMGVVLNSAELASVNTVLYSVHNY